MSEKDLEFPLTKRMQLDLVNECPALLELVGDNYYTCRRTILSSLEVCEYLIKRGKEWVKDLNRFRELLAEEYRQNGTDITVVVQMGSIYLEGDFSDSLARKLEEERWACLLTDEENDDLDSLG